VTAALVLELCQLRLETLTLILVGGGVHFRSFGLDEGLLGGPGIHEARHESSIADPTAPWRSDRPG